MNKLQELTFNFSKNIFLFNNFKQSNSIDWVVSTFEINKNRILLFNSLNAFNLFDQKLNIYVGSKTWNKACLIFIEMEVHVIN